LRTINIDENGNMRSPLPPLNYKHFAHMFEVAWDKAFTREWNMKGWEKEGNLPRFNKKEYWRFKAGLVAAEADGATVSSRGGSNNTNDGMSGASTPPSTDGSASGATEVQLLLLG
jgi:hypothetical protein